MKQRDEEATSSLKIRTANGRSVLELKEGERVKAYPDCPLGDDPAVAVGNEPDDPLASNVPVNPTERVGRRCESVWELQRDTLKR